MQKNGSKRKINQSIRQNVLHEMEQDADDEKNKQTW